MPYKEESKKARRCAIRYLVYRDRSRSEITLYLKGKRFSANAVDETLAFLKDHDYINDPRFAQQFGRSRIKNKKVGKLRLKRELKDKGLESHIISGVLNSLYEEFDEREIAMLCAKKKFNPFHPLTLKKHAADWRGFSNEKASPLALSTKW